MKRAGIFRPIEDRRREGSLREGLLEGFSPGSYFRADSQRLRQLAQQRGVHHNRQRGGLDCLSSVIESFIPVSPPPESDQVSRLCGLAFSHRPQMQTALPVCHAKSPLPPKHSRQALLVLRDSNLPKNACPFPFFFHSSILSIHFSIQPRSRR